MEGNCREYEGEQSIFSGTFYFAKNVLNPLDTNYASSTAALGVFNSYTESNQRFGANMRQTLFEWFAQDSWRVTRRLNIDYGVRWTWASQMHPSHPGEQSVWMRSLYDPSKAPTLYGLTVAGAQVNTLFGQVTSTRSPRVMQGSLRFTF